LPEALLELWQHWDSYWKELEAMCPWGKHGFNPEPAPRGDGSRPNVIAAFNLAHPVEGLLAAHGYTRRGNHWMSPTSSSGLAGTVIIEGRVYSHHASDPLSDGHAHDAFDLFRILDHGGDARAAVKAAAEELGMGSAAGAKSPGGSYGLGNGASPADDSASPE
jgi:putative DNA primase/helicase